MGLRNIKDIDIALEDILTESHSYEALALIYLLECQRELEKDNINKMIAESKWIQSCLESGFIQPITEAEGEEKTTNSKTTANVKKPGGDKLSKLKDAIAQWIKAFIDKIKHDVAERHSKYAPWVEDHADEFLGLDVTNDTVTVVPFHKGTYSEDASKCVTAITKGIGFINSGRYDDYSYADGLVERDMLTGKNVSGMNVYLKNYFRTNQKNTENINKVTLKGTELKGLINEFIKYVTTYESVTVKNVTRIGDAYNKLGNVKEPVTDSINANTYLSVEDRLVCESSLVSLINYSAIFEADDNKEKVEAKIDGEKGGSVTSVQSDDKGDKTPTGTDKGDDSSKPKPEDAKRTEYINTFRTFATSLMATYSSACDERMIAYFGILKHLADKHNIPGPRYDDKGNYIKKESATKTKEEKPKETK